MPGAFETVPEPLECGDDTFSRPLHRFAASVTLGYLLLYLPA